MRHHSHPEDDLSTLDAAQTFKIGLALVHDLGQRLGQSFQDQGFRINVSLGNGNQSTVRIYRTREGQSGAAPDLNGYAEAVAAFKVKPCACPQSRTQSH